ncbi:hypothetical protein [Burkholderia ubonensis]|uniref:hypothetical protein n=1 Tax=Burkholderia ubonensis TaxID=101571 RepID=UPI0012F9A2C4|nr:hypothetical protein [Burkholderia ubonensis]
MGVVAAGAGQRVGDVHDRAGRVVHRDAAGFDPARHDCAAGQIDAAAADVDIDAMRAPAVGIDGDVLGKRAAAHADVDALAEEAAGADFGVAQFDARAGAGGRRAQRTGAGREQARLAGGGRHTAVDRGKHRLVVAGRRLVAGRYLERDAVRARRGRRRMAQPGNGTPSAGDSLRKQEFAIHPFTHLS